MINWNEIAAIRGFYLQGATIKKIAELSGLSEKEIEIIIADLKKYVDSDKKNRETW